MNSPATVRPPGRSRLALIVAGVLALLGSFAVTAPAQAGYYDDSNYGYNYGSYPCSYRSRCGYGYSPYRYARRYYNGCSACGCYRRCGVARSGVVYERRYVERSYVERRYGYGGYRRHYGYNPYGGYRRDYGYPYGAYRSRSLLSGAAGHRMATATNRPPMDMRSRRGRRRRFGARPTTTKPFLMATRIELPANHGHAIQHCRHLLLAME